MERASGRLPPVPSLVEPAGAFAHTGLEGTDDPSDTRWGVLCWLWIGRLSEVGWREGGITWEQGGGASRSRSGEA